MSTNESRVLTSEQTNAAKVHADLLVDLPDPEESWFCDEIGWLTEKELKKLKHENLIERDERIPYEYGNECHGFRWTWSVDRHARQKAEQVRENRDAMVPCGDSGIENIGDDLFTCSYDHCGETFTRAEVLDHGRD